MSLQADIETGTTGRIIYARVRPNEDLVQGIEKICLQEGVSRCFVRGSLGSLNDACVSLSDETLQVLRGPAVEVVGMSGEVRPDADGNPVAAVTGVLAEPGGRICGGRFIRGQNPVCVTFEIVLEEWLVADTATGAAGA
ncbi:PCC domain-containing protein [Stappia stellulata]|uniref:PCC domain-containing protein n=1 Tax=Stappia stellulata TaxID=71235 RepID=UPI00041E952E|nr:PPC domain-containing DNA-binding protein [Stappia stellulata]